MPSHIVIGRAGACIYCRTSEGPLDEEHIVPYGLDGPWVLRETSCRKCADITKAFEQSVLRESLIVPRAALDLPTSRKAERPKTFPLTVSTDGRTDTVKVPITEHFAGMILPIIEPLAHLTGRPYEKGVTVKGAVMAQVGGMPAAHLKGRYGGDRLSITVTWRGNDFERLLAKIGYGFPVAKLGLAKLREPYVLPAILGTRHDGLAALMRDSLVLARIFMKSPSWSNAMRSSFE